MLGQSLIRMAWWLWASIAWIAPSKHHISCTQPHQQKIPSSETARILRDRQRWSVKTPAGNARAGRRICRAQPAAGGERRRKPHKQWEPGRPCLTPGCPRGARGGESGAVIPPWWGHFPTPGRLLPPLGSSCSSSEGKGWRGLVGFANTVNKMLILCLAVVSLSLVTCSYWSRC